MSNDAVEAMSWDDFSAKFRVEFVQESEAQQLVQELLDLQQMTEAMAGISGESLLGTAICSR